MISQSSTSNGNQEQNLNSEYYAVITSCWEHFGGHIHSHICIATSWQPQPHMYSHILAATAHGQWPSPCPPASSLYRNSLPPPVCCISMILSNILKILDDFEEVACSTLLQEVLLLCRRWMVSPSSLRFYSDTAPQDYCGRCQIRTRDLCSEVWWCATNELLH